MHCKEGPFLPFPCKLPCRKSRLISSSSSSLINCNYLFEILKTAAKTTTTTTTPKSSSELSWSAMAAMGGALEEDGETVGRGGRATSVVGRTMGKSTPIIPSMQLAQCPLRDTVESNEFAIESITINAKFRTSLLMKSNNFEFNNTTNVSHLSSTVKGVAANDECAGVVLCCHRGFTVVTFDNKHHQEISRNNCKLLEKRREREREIAVASCVGTEIECAQRGNHEATHISHTFLICLTVRGPQNLLRVVEMIVLNGRPALVYNLPPMIER